MQTVCYRVIDGHKIITGFGKLVIDPVETRKAVKDIIHETDEGKAVASKQREIEEKAGVARAAMNAARIAQKAKKTNQAALKSDEAQAATEAIQNLMSELKELLPPLEEKRKELMRDRAVYFMPKKGESQISDPDLALLAQKFSVMPAGHVLDIEGKVLPDNRGIKYWHKSGSVWSPGRVQKLGEVMPSGAKTQDALTEAEEAQIEEQRVSALSAGAKAGEKATAELSALQEATNMRLELEIQGDTEALSKSQAEYEAEMALIAEKYA